MSVRPPLPLVSLFALSAVSACLTTTLHANPVLDHLAAGEASIQQSDHTTTINQTSDRAIIDWKSFNIHADETTRFNQPEGGVTLNRIDPSSGASQIYGHLSSNGQVLLINPNGIFFGASAYVNVGSLIASTANMTDQDFLNGRYHFTADPAYTGSVINQGTLIAAKHGLLALIGRGVRNDGQIEATLGHVVLLAGEVMTLSFAGNSFIHFAIEEGVLEKGVDLQGQPLAAGISNTGKLSAAGGKILISAKTAENVLDHVINMQGIVEARSISKEHGTIILSGDPLRGEVDVGGTLDASGKAPLQTGGLINITGYHLLLDSPALLDVSGDLGGGQINIGGELRGQGNLPHANATVLMPHAAIYANAITEGDGGRVVLWSDEVTRAYGTIEARGGREHGNGGLVETSSHHFLDVAGLRVNTAGGLHGKAGTWLLDPYNVTICTPTGGPISTCTTFNGSFSSGVFTPTGSPSLVSTTDIVTNLNSSNVTITTGSSGSEAGNITVSANTAITWTSDYSLALSAANNITINTDSDITNTTSSLANLTLTGDTSSGTITVNSAINIKGALTLSAGTVSLPRTITAGSVTSTSTNTVNGTTIESTVTTTGAQTYNGLLLLQVLPVFSVGGNFTVNNTLAAAVTSLTITGTGSGSQTFTFGGAFQNTLQITISGGTSNTLALLNTETSPISWSITGSDAGSVTGPANLTAINFSNMSGLTGSYANTNTFTYSNGAALSGDITMSGTSSSNTQTINYANNTSAVSVVLTSVSAGSASRNGTTITNAFSGINSLIGPGSSSTLNLSNTPSLSVSYTTATSGYINSTLTFNGFSITNATAANQTNYSTAVSQTAVVSNTSTATNDDSPNNPDSSSNTNSSTGEAGWVQTNTTINQTLAKTTETTNAQYEQTLQQTVINPSCS